MDEIKRKLSIEEQILDMKSKKVKFEICSEEEAKRFLKYNSYYFKLKSYAKNYNYNPVEKKYYNLDFAYLIELSKLDMYLRKEILTLALDVEHYLKVRLLFDLNNNENEDGYAIVKTYLDSYPSVKNEIESRANKYSFCSDLIEKSIDENSDINNLALWKIVELLSFGNFMELYEIYYQTYDSFNYSVYLKSIKFIRNAAAHNNCILSSIKKPNSTKKFVKTKKLATIMGKTPEFKDIENINGMMSNPVIHDFVVLLYVYNDIMKMTGTKETRNKKMQELKYLFCDEEGRFKKNASYFNTNPYLKNAYEFICEMIKYFDKKNHNPKHTNYL